jgi:hypothetical protein
MKPSKSQASVAGTPGLLEIPGDQPRTLLVTKPSANDLIIVRRWVLSQQLPEQARGLSSAELAGLTPEDRMVLIKEYAKAKAGGRREPTEAESLELLCSREGVVLMVWLAARKHQPITREEVSAFVTAENCEEIMALLDKAIDANEEPTDPKAPGGSPSSPAT